MRKLALGLMSGTSGDGVSLALAAFKNRHFDLLHYETFPYPARMAEKIRGVACLSTVEISKFNFELGHFFAQASLKFLSKAGVRPSRIAVIGSHGHTVHHGPWDAPRHTLQIGEPAVIAEKIGVPVVADFRPRDIAAGGQGAPLIPFFDQYFFGGGPARAMQNIGGMANVTLVGKSVSPVAFDNGPGNVLIDWAVEKISKGKYSFDADGRMARHGVIDMQCVRAMASHPYFLRNPPKSTGRELFNETFLPTSLLLEKKENLIATLTYFTAYIIRESYRRFLPSQPSEIIVSGGGALNHTLMNHLSNLFYPIPVRSIACRGLHPQAKEPLAFAFFALRALEGKINHLPQTTGAHRACILGKIIPARPPHADAWDCITWRRAGAFTPAYAAS